MKKFSYWNDGLLEDSMSIQRANRYVVFDIDIGGLNNIRIAFEYVVVLAAITGRTLVLPPQSSWYLINRGPMPEDQKGGTTKLGDIFDIDSLKKALPVISSQQFVENASSHLKIPEEFQRAGILSNPTNQTLKAWQAWLQENSEIPPWNPHESLVCWPDIKTAATGPHLNGSYLDNRTPVEFSPWMNAAPLIYFPSNKVNRYLGPVATMLACADESVPIISRRLLKHHVRYRNELFDLARLIIEKLKLDRYDSLQIRRNDFQYKKTRLGMEKICSNIEALFDEQLPIYIASDETRPEVFKELRHHLDSPKIYNWEDAKKVIDCDLPYAWIGPLEQLICAGARRFVGTDLSTFCTYINRLRGYMKCEDQNSYYHSEHYPEVPESAVSEAYRGRAYLRENPLFWLAC